MVNFKREFASQTLLTTKMLMLLAASLFVRCCLSAYETSFILPLLKHGELQNVQLDDKGLTDKFMMMLDESDAKLLKYRKKSMESKVAKKAGTKDLRKSIETLNRERKNRKLQKKLKKRQPKPRKQVTYDEFDASDYMKSDGGSAHDTAPNIELQMAETRVTGNGIEEEDPNANDE